MPFIIFQHFEQKLSAKYPYLINTANQSHTHTELVQKAVTIVTWTALVPVRYLQFL